MVENFVLKKLYCGHIAGCSAVIDIKTRQFEALASLSYGVHNVECPTF